MTWFDAIFLGLVQGLTGFLPISSSAHLRILGKLVGKEDPGAAFTAVTQIGTETAMVIVLWKDIVRIPSHWWKTLSFIPAARRLPSLDPDARMGWMIVLGSLPIGVLGPLLQNWIDTSFRNLWITVVVLALFGVLLGFVGSKMRQVRIPDRMSWRDAILCGLAQVMALIPGTSRSGGTITMERALGYTREAAAHYSFLLAMPTVFASGLYKVYKILSGGDVVTVPQTAVATLIAFLVAWTVIIWFLKLVSTKSYKPFVYYRTGLAIVVVALLPTGALMPASTAGLA